MEEAAAPKPKPLALAVEVVATDAESGEPLQREQGVLTVPDDLGDSEFEFLTVRAEEHISSNLGLEEKARPAAQARAYRYVLPLRREALVELFCEDTEGKPTRRIEATAVQMHGERDVKSVWCEEIRPGRLRVHEVPFWKDEPFVLGVVQWPESLALDEFAGPRDENQAEAADRLQGRIGGTLRVRTTLEARSRLPLPASSALRACGTCCGSG